MWNGGPPNPPHLNGGATDPAALAASALAAYTTGSDVSSSQAAYAGGYAHPTSSMVSTYQAHAMEALRRQEEMRQQAYIALQHRQNQTDSYAGHGIYDEDEGVEPRHPEEQHDSDDESVSLARESTTPRQQEDNDEEEEQATIEHLTTQVSRETSPTQNNSEELDADISNPLVSEVTVAEPVTDDVVETTTAVVVLEDPSTSPATPAAATSSSSSKKKEKFFS